MRSNRTLERILPMRGALVAAGLLALALGLACGGDETPAEQAGAEAPSKKIDIPQTEGEEPMEAELAQNELPSTFPDDMPRFPGAEPTTSMLVPGGTGMVVFSSPGSAQEVADFYAKALPEQGWTVNATSPDGKRLQASKDTRSATVSIDEGEGGSEIAVVLGGA